MTTTCKRSRRIRINRRFETNVDFIINKPRRLCPLNFRIPIEEMKLSKDYRSIAKEIIDCGGYSGHCGCLNNACMMCTAFH